VWGSKHRQPDGCTAQSRTAPGRAQVLPGRRRCDRGEVDPPPQRASHGSTDPLAGESVRLFLRVLAFCKYVQRRDIQQPGILQGRAVSIVRSPRRSRLCLNFPGQASRRQLGTSCLFRPLRLPYLGWLETNAASPQPLGNHGRCRPLTLLSSRYVAARVRPDRTQRFSLHPAALSPACPFPTVLASGVRKEFLRWLPTFGSKKICPP
jgi:hypothetical protein